MTVMFASIGTQIGQFIERKQLEDQYRQAQKMEAIGTLAGGIAHDFNNVLTAISGYTELARLESHGNSQVLEYLQAVATGSRRATDLVRQILAFSRLQVQERKPIQLWSVVEEALQLLRATLPVTIQFETLLDRRGPAVLADPTQIHQIIMNLATTAAHAMRVGTGRLRVVLEAIEVDDALVATHPGLRLGSYMRIAISDSGHGMDEATLSRIFDPFFTTKGPGEGTGLGLAVVHGIMQNHDGLVTVSSTVGVGTEFQLYFPAHEGAITSLAMAEQEPERGNGERILYVDDEAPLALMGKKFLERLGYVIEAHTVPMDALAALKANPTGYDLVITDLTMPGMTGIQLAEEVRRLRPDLPVILMTGYAAAVDTDATRALGIHAVLAKPQNLGALAAAVQRALNRHQRNTPP